MTSRTAQRAAAKAAVAASPTSAIVGLISQPEWPPAQGLLTEVVSRMSGQMHLTRVIDSASLREIVERAKFLQQLFAALADDERDPDRQEALRQASQEAYAFSILVAAGRNFPSQRAAS